MPKPKQKHSKKVAQLSGDSFLIADEKKVPLFSTTGTRSPEVVYAHEYQIIDSLKVNASAMFPKEKLNVINALRRRAHIINGKKFLVRKASETHGRIWRLPNNAVIKAHGGRIAGVSPLKKGVPRKDATDNSNT